MAPSRIEKYKEMIKTTRFHAPIGELLGMKFTQIEMEKAIFELDVEKKHLNSVGVVQGGVLTTMADAAMGIAFGTLVDPETKFASIEIKISFLKPVMHGRLIAKGIVLKKGKRAGFTESKIYLNSIEEKNLVAKASSSLIIL